MSFAEKTSMLDWMARLYLPPVIIRPGTLREKSSTLSEYQRFDITRIVVTFCGLTIKRVNSTENSNDIMLDTFRS